VVKISKDAIFVDLGARAKVLQISQNSWTKRGTSASGRRSGGAEVASTRDGIHLTKNEGQVGMP
jgi:hypothetical protein